MIAIGIGYLLACVMGMTLGLIGAGGSILAVPILVYFMGVDPVSATGYSLLIVGVTALLGSVRYIKKSQIDMKLAVTFAIPSIVAVYLSRLWLVPKMPDPFFTSGSYVLSKDAFIMALFSVLMLLSSWFMIRNGAAQPSPSKQPQNQSVNAVYMCIDGFLVGGMTGIVGAGGGFLIIPALILLTNIDMKKAVGTSLFIIAMKSLIGFVGDIQSGADIDTYLIISFLCATSIGMIIGIALSNHISGQNIKKAFGWFTLCVGTIIIFKEMI